MQRCNQNRTKRIFLESHGCDEYARTESYRMGGMIACVILMNKYFYACGIIDS